MMRTVHLHGALGQKYGEQIRFDIATAAEAVRALTANFPEFLDDVREGAWHVVRGDSPETGLSLGEDDLVGFRLGKGDLHILPYVAGSKNGGTLKIVLGVALVGLGFFMGFGAPILGQAMAASTGISFTYGNLAMLGAAMALAGASQLLSPEEKGKDKTESYTFNGPGNAYNQGSPVPLVYGGPLITGGVMVSGGIDIEKLKA